MNKLYKVAKISKQAFHQQKKRENVFNERLSILLEEVAILRSVHPGCGVEKMYDTLRPDWIGRDRFIETMMGLGYRVKIIKNYTKTTIPVSKKYPNLIEGMLLWDKDMLWQSDITFIRIGTSFLYLVFIVDVYTKQILGYQASDHLRASANLAALKMAINKRRGNIEGLVHHSDRGSQYVEKQYTGLLENKGVHISMGNKAQENAYAERVNGIIKNEYLTYWQIKDLSMLRRLLHRAINHYNSKRIHSSLPNKKTPNAFEQELISLKGQERPTVIVYADGNLKLKEASIHLEFLPEKKPRAHVCPIINESQ